ncbi:MAG: hypothetical protein ACXAAO_14955 [Candidatus Thorarchaeota archaeon]
MVREEKLRQLAGGLLIVSAVTHTIQVFVYGGIWHNIGAALYGVMYLFLGIGLIKFPENRFVLPLSVILPLVGGVGGVIRFFFLHTSEPNLFIILHVLIDVVVVPVCAFLFKTARETGPESVESLEQLLAVAI